ncbi:MAG: mandelate racemase/muconate lactonizing enzyme family protein [Bacteroidota bacterium]
MKFAKRRNFLRNLGLTAGALTGLPLLSLGKNRLETVHTEARSKAKDALESIKITDIEFFTLEFPNKTPLTWNAIKKSGGSKPKTTFMRLKTDAGITGICAPKGPRNTVEKYAKKIKGLNLFHTEKVWDYMYHHNRKPVAKGLELHAIGSVDLAVWDIIGKALNMPVHKVLGTYQEDITVYAAGGYYAKDKGVPELVKEMEDYAKEGYKIVKMKVGFYEDVYKDVERVKAVVKALGRDVRVMVDANNGYKSAYEAIRFGRMVEDLDLYWFEEPVAPDDWRGNAECRANLDIPITAGENEYTRWGARDLVENHCCDIINMDTIKSGGITEYKKIAALASAYHIPVAPHGYAHMNIHVVASTSNASVLETYPKKARDFNPALPAFPVKDGKVKAPTEAGLGMTLEESFIKKYRVG